MKSLFNLRTILFAITVSLLAGCSGITETTLPDAEPLDISIGQTLNHDEPESAETNRPLQPIVEEREDSYGERD